MNTPARAPIPTTFALLKRTKQSRQRTTFDRVQWCLLVASGALIAMAVAVAASGSRGWISIAVTQNLVMVTLGLFLLVFLAWGITHIIEAIQASRAGFQPMAERVDKAMASVRLRAPARVRKPDQAHRRPACSGEPESDRRAPVIKAPHTRRVSPVGACIYCGTTNGVLRGFSRTGAKQWGSIAANPISARRRRP